MSPEKLPDQSAPGSDRVYATIANVAAIMSEAGITARYNVIKKKVEIELPSHQGTPDNLDNVSLSHIHSLCAALGMPTGNVGEYVNVIADRNAYNPVADWIRSKAWDGEDRLPALLATVVEQPEYPPELKEVLLRKWLRSAAAAALVEGYKGRGVLTLQGPQGIGKTSWMKALVSDGALRDSVVKLDHHLDGSSKDSVITAVEHWIVEIGELDSSFKKDIARLKGFLTADTDRLRRPYDRRNSSYPRRTVFGATVNETSFLVDPTGNSRWWTVAVDGLDFNHGIDTQQLFAQLAAEVEGGAEWWLTPDEERQLADWNGRHAAASVVADRVLGVLELDTESRDKTEALTATEVLQRAGIDHPTNPQAKECGALLREHVGPPRRIQGRDRWHVTIRGSNVPDYHVQPTRSATPRPTVRQPDPTDVF